MKANLGKLGVISDSDCPLCGRNEETVELLYFECDCSRACCEALRTVVKAVKQRKLR